MFEKRHRSFAKAISWRAVGSVDTLIIGWVITGHFVTALSISGVELVTKVTLYWVHERVWQKIQWGRAS